MTTVRASGRNAAAISPRQLAHMVVQASDMDKSRKWYEQVLGARTIFHSDFAFSNV
jgi:Glyoxalase/Bleomycin resistance protein/Dioxygenase superfamily